jgi:hypothetical protein
MTSSARFLDALQQLVRDCAKLKRVLVVGPGTTDPIADLLTVLPSADLTLIEVDPVAAATLQRRWDSTARVRCICGDAANSESAQDAYDLVVIRHPDTAQFRHRWANVLERTVRSTLSNGLMIVCTYSLDELQFVIAMLHTQPVCPVAGAPYTTIPLGLQGNDRYIVAYQRIEEVISEHSSST